MTSPSQRAVLASLLSLCLLAASLPQASSTLSSLFCSSKRITKTRIIDWQQRLFFTSNILNYPGGGASGLRGWAMMTLAMFDAANLASDSKFSSYLDFSDLPASIDVDRAEPLAAAAKAAQIVLDSLIPASTPATTATQLRYTHLAQFQTHLDNLADNTRTRNGIALGQYVGQKMVQNRTGDGHPPNDCNAWPNPATPACPNFVVNSTAYDLYSYNYPFFPGNPQSPGYPLVRPFGVGSYADPRFAVPAPPAFDSPAFLSQWQQLFGYATSRPGQSTRTTETDNIAKFHNGNFGSSISFATDALSSADSITIDGVDLLRVLSLAALSSHDAHAIHWRYKYIHNRARPITAYRFVPPTVPSLYGYQDSNWTPVLATSQTPEYPSGHASRTSGVSAAFIKAFGDYVFGGFQSISVSDPGQGPRKYSSFSQFQEEVQISRVYGGVHWSVSGVAGRTLGEAVVNYVWPRLLTPNGSGHYFADDQEDD